MFADSSAIGTSLSCALASEYSRRAFSPLLSCPLLFSPAATHTSYIFSSRSRLQSRLRGQETNYRFRRYRRFARPRKIHKQESEGEGLGLSADLLENDETSRRRIGQMAFWRLFPCFCRRRRALAEAFVRDFLLCVFTRARKRRLLRYISSYLAGRVLFPLFSLAVSPSLRRAAYCSACELDLLSWKVLGWCGSRLTWNVK